MNVLPEMLALWLLETTASVIVFYVLLHNTALLPSLVASFSGLDAADALLLALTVGLVAFTIGLYRPETCLETRRLIGKALASAAMSVPAVWVVAEAGNMDSNGLFGSNPIWPIGILFAWSGLLLFTRVLYKIALRHNLFIRRMVVLGGDDAVGEIVSSIDGSRRGLFRAQPLTESRGQALIGVEATAPAPLPAGLWGVVFDSAPVPAGLPGGVRVFDAASFSETHLNRIDIDSVARRGEASRSAQAATPFGRLAMIREGRRMARRVTDNPRRRLVQDILQRGMDLAIAVPLLLLSSPILLITALLIRLESPGPVIYRQERVGLDGRSFTILKFRSMRADAERAGPTWAAKSDSRVTRIGGFIRKVRIDELPQLMNILRGDMSVVGPRPERPHFVAQLSREIPVFAERARVKPGLTGWAQINYPYGSSIEDARNKLSFDLYYIKHRSLLFNLVILFATIRVILFQEGAR